MMILELLLALRYLRRLASTWLVLSCNVPCQRQDKMVSQNFFRQPILNATVQYTSERITHVVSAKNERKPISLVTDCNVFLLSWTYEGCVQKSGDIRGTCTYNLASGP